MRLRNLDLLKTIAIFMVITLHTVLWHYNFSKVSQISHIIQYAFRLIAEGVPLFIMVNGYLLIKNPHVFDLEKHLKKSLKMFVLMIIWGGILTISIMLVEGKAFNIKDIIISVCSIHLGNRYTGVLWFMQALIGLYLLVPILLTVKKADEKLYCYLFLIVAAFSIGLSSLKLLCDFSLAFFNTPKIVTIMNNFNRINPFTNAHFLLYFMIGGYLRQYQDVLKIRIRKPVVIGICAWAIAFVIGLVLSLKIGKTYSPSFNYGSLFMVVIITTLFLATIDCDIKGKFAKLVTFVGQNTLGIYFVHYLVIKFFWGIGVFNSSFGSRLGLTVMVYFACIILIYIIRKIPILNYLVKI